VATYRMFRNGIVVSLIPLFGGAIYLIIRQSSYHETSAAEWFAGDTVLLGLIAIVAAVVTAAFAYPTFLEWKDQISGPTPSMTVRYEMDEGNFKDLPEEAELIQDWPKEHFPVLQIRVDNSFGRVPLRDGRLGIYVQHRSEGNHAPPLVDLKPRDGKASKFERISHVHSQEEPEVPATLLSAECPCPPRGTSYLEERFGIHEPDVYLRFVLTGSNLQVPLTQRHKVHLSPTPGNSSRA